MEYRLTVLIVISLASLLSPPHSLAIDVEYQIKAGFLGNFAKFVRWPPEIFENSGSPYILGILGEDPFGSFMDEAVEAFEIEGRRMVIKRFPNIATYEFCHILFISSSQKTLLDPIFWKLKTLPTLTVSETAEFCKKGGMINFIFVKNNIRFQINVGATEKAQLKVSSSLLSLAREIIPTQN